jgi:RNA polymerase sigma-70 factor, ECF subfamily
MDVTVYERERSWLVGVAYRILGSVADAEDVVQEAFMRATDATDVRSPRAFLTTVVTRLCLDEVRCARRKREGYTGLWLPEPIATEAMTDTDRIEMSESLSMAFLLLLESLSPTQRAVFVLHEVFDLSMAEVSEAVGHSEVACRQVLHRARERVTHTQPKKRPSVMVLESAISALMIAFAQGDLETLKTLLLDEVEAQTDHGGKASAARKVVTGTDDVARFVLGLAMKFARSGGMTRAVWINGTVAFVAIEADVVTSVVIPEMADDGRVETFWSVRNPDKLASMTVAMHNGNLRDFQGFRSTV